MRALVARHAVEPATFPPDRRGFRSEIQALRAVAVAGVVIYHLWPAALPGGFVGVDVFFVISGFLITQQLTDEAAAGGRISLTRFWARRIRRILPAAFAVLIACVAAVVLVLPRVAWPTNLAEIRAAAAYAENWQLAARAVDYLAAEGNASLVQHYWSLSVEEQFYLAWPLLLLLAIALDRRRPGGRTWPVTVLAIAGVVSFVVSLRWTAADPATAFFATPARAWEFAAGGLAGVLVPRTPSARTATARRVANVLGLVLILSAMVRITGTDPFPGTSALLPVAGAALVVAAELPTTGGLLARLTGAAPVQWVGDGSYSIYLWHWPLVVAAPWVVHREASASDRVAILAASLALAALTKRLVEDPVRTGTLWRSRTWLTYAIPVVGVTALVATSSTILVRSRVAETQAVAAAREDATRQTQALVAEAPGAGRGGARRAAPPARSCFGAAAMDPANRCPRPYARPSSLDTAFAAADGSDDPCLQQLDAATPDFCTVGRTVGATRTVALVGNSHAWRLIPALALYGQQHRWKILVATRIDCLGLLTTAVASDGASPNCLKWSAAVQRRLLSLPHLDAVVFPGYRYANTFTVGHRPTPQELDAGRRQVLTLWSALAARGARVVVSDDVPGVRPQSAPDCIARSSHAYDPCAVERGSVVAANLVTDLARANPPVASYVPLTQYFCDTSRCHALIGGVVVYFDGHHLTTTFSRSLARYLGDAVSKAMQPTAR